jgi:plasmid maintenance system antidote protein VapI
MQHGRALLKAWIDRMGLTQRAAAQLLGIDHTFLNQMLTGRRLPSLANAIRIEHRTGVSVESWVPTTVGTFNDEIAASERKRKSA